MKKEAYYMNKKNGLVYHAFTGGDIPDYKKWTTYTTINNCRREYCVYVDLGKEVSKDWVEVDGGDYWWNYDADHARKAYVYALKLEKKDCARYHVEDSLEMVEAVKGAYLAGELFMTEWELHNVAIKELV